MLTPKTILREKKVSGGEPGEGGAIAVYEGEDQVVEEATGIRIDGAEVAASGTVAVITIPAQALTAGRLTLASGTPVTSVDITGATNLYHVPFLHDQFSVWTAEKGWVPRTIVPIAIPLGTLTSGKNYDVFAYDDGGELAYEFSAAWTNDTTRADAIAILNGREVKSSDHTRALVGSFRTTSTTTTEDSDKKRFVWNAHNARPKRLRVFETTNSWSWNTGSWHQANASAANQVEVLIGRAGATVELDLHVNSANSPAGDVNYGVGIGHDRVDGCSGIQGIPGPFGGASRIDCRNAHTSDMPTLGYHYYAWLEYGAGTTTTFYGDGGGTGTTIQGGMVGSISGV